MQNVVEFLALLFVPSAGNSGTRGRRTSFTNCNAQVYHICTCVCIKFILFFNLSKRTDTKAGTWSGE